MIKVVIFFIVVCELTIFPLHAGELSYNKLTIVTEHSPPYQMFDSSNNVVGLTTSIVEAALARTDINYQISIYPWSRSFVMAKENPNTCVYLMSRTQSREKHFQWVAPLVPIDDYFVGLSTRNDIKIDTLEDAKRYKVAVLKDDRTHHKLLELGFVENKNLYVINNTYSMLQLLLTRKTIDLVLADTINIEYRAKYNDIDPNLFRTYFKLTQRPIQLYFACSLQTPKKVITELQKAFTYIKENDTYDKIIKQWRAMPLR